MKTYKFTDQTTGEAFLLECEPWQSHNPQNVCPNFAKWAEGRILRQEESTGPITGYFSQDQTTYTNLGVSKESPNRIGKVVEVLSLLIGKEPVKFAQVQFRDFKEGIRI